MKKYVVFILLFSGVIFAAQAQSLEIFAHLNKNVIFFRPEPPSFIVPDVLDESKGNIGFAIGLRKPFKLRGKQMSIGLSLQNASGKYSIQEGSEPWFNKYTGTYNSGLLSLELIPVSINLSDFVIEFGFSANASVQKHKNGNYEVQGLIFDVDADYSVTRITAFGAGILGQLNYSISNTEKTNIALYFRAYFSPFKEIGYRIDNMIFRPAFGIKYGF